MPKHSITPFTYYTFRYDYTDEKVVELIKNYIIREFPKYAIFREVSDVVGKKHLQGKIGKAMSNVQVRKKLLLEFPNVFCRTNYSCKDIQHAEEYDSYICKDGDVLINNVFSQEFIDEAVALHKKKVSEFTAKQTKRSAVLPFTHKVVLDFMVEYPIETQIIQSPEYKMTDSQQKIYDKACEGLLFYLLKRLGKIVKQFDDNILQRMYNSIKNHILMCDDKASQVQKNFYLGRIQL